MGNQVKLLNCPFWAGPAYINTEVNQNYPNQHRAECRMCNACTEWAYENQGGKQAAAAFWNKRHATVAIERYKATYRAKLENESGSNETNACLRFALEVLDYVSSELAATPQNQPKEESRDE